MKNNSFRAREFFKTKTPCFHLTTGHIFYAVFCSVNLKTLNCLPQLNNFLILQRHTHSKGKMPVFIGVANAWIVNAKTSSLQIEWQKFSLWSWKFETDKSSLSSVKKYVRAWQKPHQTHLPPHAVCLFQMHTLLSTERTFVPENFHSQNAKPVCAMPAQLHFSKKQKGFPVIRESFFETTSLTGVVHDNALCGLCFITRRLMPHCQKKFGQSEIT